MHDDDSTGTDQLTVGEPTSLLAALVIHDSYHCDQGTHHSKTVAGTAPQLLPDPKTERPAAKAGQS